MSDYQSFHSLISWALCIRPKLSVWNFNNGGGSAVKLLDFFKNLTLRYSHFTTQRRPAHTPLLLKARGATLSIRSCSCERKCELLEMDKSL